MSINHEERTQRIRVATEWAQYEADRRDVERVPEFPPRLYHYTGLSGMMGILTSGQIWATHASYLNDSRELIHAETITKEIIADRMASTRSQLVKHFLRYVIHEIDGFSIVPCYVASFCEEPDLLSQWRGYGQGLGYAVGFEPDEDLSMQPVVKDARIIRVIYDEKSQKEILTDIIDRYIFSMMGIGQWEGFFEKSTLDKLESIVPRESYPHIKLDYKGTDTEVMAAVDALHLPLICIRDELHIEFMRMKHSGFAEEREWRIVYPDTQGQLQAKYRQSNGYLVPYVVLPLLWVEGDRKNFAGFNLKEVVCGPCNNQEAAIHSLKGWLQMVPYNVDPEYGVSVRGANTPYRTWSG